jgi:hypothetical protein
MKTLLALFGLGVAATWSAAAGPSLTIYNQGFAVVRDTVPLDLKAGVNDLRYPDATAQVEADSVILRDPTGQHSLQILEQNYRNDPVSQELLLSLFEGKTIDFARVRTKDNTQVTETVAGRVVRSGFVPGGGSEQPIIEVNGVLQFSLPGEPRFPSLGDNTVLKPSFNWRLQTAQPGKFDAEIGYVTGGFSWNASYNLVAPETGDTLDLIGWVTIKNECGKTFDEAKIKVLAGDVNKIQPMYRGGFGGGGARPVAMMEMEAAAPAVTEKAFDEYHLYSIARPTTLRDRETKQVEFVSATGVYAPVIYVYDGADTGYRFYGGLNQDRGYGTTSNKKVTIMREFVNAETNQLGMPLPAGKLRFYRRDDDGQLEFTGENTIDHTPRNETIRLTTGNAFDLVGERKQTDFHIDTGDKRLDETFEIALRNRKTSPVTFRVVEHLYRWNNWTLTAKSDDYTKKDAQTIEFNVPVAPDQERKVTYTVHYTW